MCQYKTVSVVLSVCRLPPVTECNLLVCPGLARLVCLPRERGPDCVRLTVPAQSVTTWFLSSVDFKENGDTSDVVDHCVIFFPFLSTGSHNCIACLLRAVLDVVGPHDAGDLFV